MTVSLSCVQSLQVHLSSSQGPIEVYICSDEPVPMEASDASVTTDGRLSPSTNGNDSVPLSPSSSFVQLSVKGKCVWGGRSHGLIPTGLWQQQQVPYVLRLLTQFSFGFSNLHCSPFLPTLCLLLHTPTQCLLPHTTPTHLPLSAPPRHLSRRC